MFPCAMSAGIVSAEARIVRLHLSEAYHGAPERLLFLSLNFCHFCVPLLFFFPRLPSFVQFLSFFISVLSLSLIRYLSFFLLFQLYVLKAVFIDFFCNFCQPLQRDQRPEVRQLHLLHMRSSARNAYIRPFVHPCDILKRTFSAPSVASFVTVRYLDVYLGKKTARKYKR